MFTLHKKHATNFFTDINKKRYLSTSYINNDKKIKKIFGLSQYTCT